jgi:hypothetical protein
MAGDTMFSGACPAEWQDEHFLNIIKNSIALIRLYFVFNKVAGKTSRSVMFDVTCSGNPARATISPRHREMDEDESRSIFPAYRDMSPDSKLTDAIATTHPWAGKARLVSFPLPFIRDIRHQNPVS